MIIFLEIFFEKMEPCVYIMRRFSDYEHEIKNIMNCKTFKTEKSDVGKSCCISRRI